jgi:hypothetical protein
MPRMTTSPARAPSEPQWRRAALTAGGVAPAAWVGVLVPFLRYGPDADQSLLVGLCALVFSFLTTHLLRRLWSEPARESTGRAVHGRRLASAFEVLVAVAILVGALAPPGVAVVGTVLLGACLAAFLGALALAVPRP